MNIDEHIYLWEQAILNKEYKEADRIRDLLDTKGVFCFTSVDGALVYHTNFKTRAEFEEQMRKDINAEKNFEAYLKSVKNSKSYKELTIKLK